MANPHLKAFSIDDLGIEAYLKARKPLHNGYDGSDLRKFVAAGVSTAAIGRLMSNDPNEPRSVNTIKDWCKRLGLKV